MNLKEVHRVLHEFYHKELTNGRQRHVVFWYDEEGEFIDNIDSLDLPDVRVLRVTTNNLFATKYELEKQDTMSHFLLYANMARPNPSQDWLLDIYKLAFEFATDKITVIMRELGIKDDVLRETFKSYKVFFNNKTRFQNFTKYPIDSYTHEAIDLTVLAVLTKSRTNGLDEVVKSLMRSHADGNQKAWENIKKYGDVEKFWELIEKHYGYRNEEKTIQSLLIFFMLTYASQHNHNITFPETWQKHMSTRPTNVIVFMNQWMNHREDRTYYNRLADQVADVVKAEHYAKPWEVTDIIDMDVFRLYDEMIIHYITDQLTANLADLNTYAAIISNRRKLHWYQEYEHEYEAVYQAVRILRLINEENLIPEQSSSAMFQSYVNDYYQIDTAYRKFYVSYDQIEQKERLQKLREQVENSYANRYMGELALKWARSLETTNPKAWPLTGISQQKDFFRNWVQPYQANDERVFVIISDAMRFEIAHELMGLLNNERKASTDISAIQSVLPSYTSLGMAALLPHKQMEYTEDATVFVDNHNTSGTNNRSQILQNTVPDSVAVQFNDVMGMNRASFREAFHGKKVIYIYHNTIDARGDHAATEMEVFQATEDAMKDIRSLVNRLVVDISVSNILITADHGFLYQRDALTTSQKTPQNINDALLAKRRFIVTGAPNEVEGTLTYAMDYLLKQENELFVSVPKGINRFAVQGAGANFVHGGAMLQEVVVPVITFKNDRSKSLANQAKKVAVKLTTPTRKITNTITYLAFLQTDRIENKKLALRLKLYFVDEDGQRVSNENIIIADSISTQPSERTFREKFVFKSMEYDKRKTYYLILEDEEEQVESVYERYPFTIDIAFSNEYGF